MTKPSKKEKQMVECQNCHRKTTTTKERTVKENGAISYYDVKVVWCDDCVSRHNYYLLSEWGQP